MGVVLCHLTYIWVAGIRIFGGYDFLIKFPDGGHGVWDDIETICNSRSEDCICHFYFLFHSGGACEKFLALFCEFSGCVM